MRIYKHLNCAERTMIQMGLEQGHTIRGIARSLDRAPSSISREMRRNGWRDTSSRPRTRGRPAVAGGYRAPVAQARADRLARKASRTSRLARHGAVWPHVESLLRTQHSPEQISAILRRMNPDAPCLHASHETVYTALHALPRGELHSELIACLRQARRNRRPRARGTDRRGIIPSMVGIHDRPVEIEERLVPGHWEGDLIKGAGNASSVGTLVERTTLFVTLVRMANATAGAAATAFGTILNRIDALRRLSMTYDQGREMARHEHLSDLTGIKVYFADPHSP